MKRISNSFINGFCLAMFATAFHQDLLGMDKYIEYVRASWIDTHWSMWIFFMIVCFYLERRGL